MLIYFDDGQKSFLFGGRNVNILHKNDQKCKISLGGVKYGTAIFNCMKSLNKQIIVDREKKKKHVKSLKNIESLI